MYVKNVIIFCNAFYINRVRKIQLRYHMPAFFYLRMQKFLLNVLLNLATRQLRSLAQLHESLDWFARCVLNFSKGQGCQKIYIFIYISIHF